MALKLRRAEERLIPQSTRAVSFKRVLGTRRTRTPIGGARRTQPLAFEQRALADPKAQPEKHRTRPWRFGTKKPMMDVHSDEDYRRDDRCNETRRD